MNLKLCKKLRRQAEQETIGMPPISFEDWAPPEFREVKVGLESKIFKARNGIPMRLGPSTRKRYRELKKEARRGD